MKRCMIVDNSNVIRKVAKRILSGPQMTVIEAQTGQEALSMCRADLPDIIIVDLALADMEAADFIRNVMAIQAEHKPHVLVCMTKLDVGGFMRAKRSGASGYILKPFVRAQLLERFREIDMAA